MGLPDLVGPTNTTGFNYPAPGGFGGTSCATPNVAGALCAFWSDRPQFSFLAINWLALEQARTLWRDWGAPGFDNVYGIGACRIVDFVANTTWVSRSYGNVSNDPSAPYHTVAAAQSAAVPGGRLLFFPGGSYPEPVTLNKLLQVQTAGAAAVVGQ